MLRIIKENRRLRKENAELRKAIEEALQDLLDPECPPGVRILSRKYGVKITVQEIKKAA